MHKAINSRTPLKELAPSQTRFCPRGGADQYNKLKWRILFQNPLFISFYKPTFISRKKYTGPDAAQSNVRCPSSPVAHNASLPQATEVNRGRISKMPQVAVRPAVTLDIVSASSTANCYQQKSDSKPKTKSAWHFKTKFLILCLYFDLL